MFNGVGASNIKLEGLQMEYTLEQFIKLENCDMVTIDGCTLRHTSGGFINCVNSTNTTIQNCHMYDSGDGGIGISNPLQLESYGNKILNNRIHDACRVYKSYVNTISASSARACGKKQ